MKWLCLTCDFLFSFDKNKRFPPDLPRRRCWQEVNLSSNGCKWRGRNMFTKSSCGLFLRAGMLELYDDVTTLYMQGWAETRQQQFLNSKKREEGFWCQHYNHNCNQAVETRVVTFSFHVLLDLLIRLLWGLFTRRVCVYIILNVFVPSVSALSLYTDVRKCLPLWK